MIISRLGLKNFKCFEDLDLCFAPLTLLCGLNGMGKSTVIQALLAWHDSMRGESLALDGQADLGTGRDVLYEGATTDFVELKICLDGGDEPSRRFECMYELTEIGDLVEHGWKEFREGRRVVGSRLASHSGGVGEDRVMHSHGLIYVNAERIGPRKIYDHSRGSALGSRGEYALSYLNQHGSGLLQDSDPRCRSDGSRTIRHVLDQWLQEVSPGAHLDFDVREDADAIIAGYTFDKKGDVRSKRFRATNVGFGLSYVLPVLVALMAPAETLCLIENPEAHLHPRGQAKLAELAVRASLAGVQVIVETHSDHFMDGVRVAVREDLAQTTDVAFHYFDRPNGDKSVVITPEVDADGRLSLWPTGFFDQHDETLARLLAPRQ